MSGSFDKSAVNPNNENTLLYRLIWSALKQAMVDTTIQNTFQFLVG